MIATAAVMGNIINKLILLKEHLYIRENVFFAAIFAKRRKILQLS